MTRADVAAAVSETEPHGTPREYVRAVLEKLGPQAVWRHVSYPVWGALWVEGEECGFVSRTIVNGQGDFLSTDSQGRDRRLSAQGKTFTSVAAGHT